MTNWLKTWVYVGLTALFLAPAPVWAQHTGPAAVLSQVTGDVTYSKGGKKWKKVRRNKFLKEGYQVKSGTDGRGTLTIQASGDSFLLQKNTQFHITHGKVITDSGKLIPSTSSALVAGMMRRFKQSQTYTTVRRSATSKHIRVRSARQLSLSKNHPYLVFESPGEKYRYEVKLGSKIIKIPATKGLLVHAKIPAFEGTLPYHITVFKGSKKVFAMRPYRKGKEKLDRQLTWLSSVKSAHITKNIAATKKAFPGNDAMLSKVYEQVGLFVPAMEAYDRYLVVSPDDEDIYPYYFWVIKKQLHLNHTYVQTMVKYQALTR